MTQAPLADSKTKPPFAHLDFGAAAVEVEERPDGSRILRSPIALQPHPDSVGQMLRSQAAAHPDALFLAERDAAGGWRRMTYAEVLAAVRALAQALLDRGLGPERPLMILSDNAVDHALLTLAAMDAGVPAAPVSQAYSLMSQDHGKLKYIHELLEPGLVYAADGERFAKAFAAIGRSGDGTVVSQNPSPGGETLATLLETTPGPAADAAFERVGPDTVCKILFTSGSTGQPKGVINIQRMLCSSQQAAAQLWRFLEARPPVVVDWLPWSHTFGANHNFNMVLRNGGALYVDGGKPAPGLIEQTVANLREVSPTMYFNVPRGYDMLIPYLERDEALRESFFRELDVIFYAAAALPQHLWEKLEDLSIRTRGERVVMLSAWGSTETSPLATSVHFTIERAGVIGLPIPGTEIKLAPSGSKMELRVRGPNVTPGYWRRDDLTREAFDEDGFFCMGDAGKLADPDDPAKGLVFDGRTAENFKLLSGTWVHVGELRLAAIAAGSPVIQDAVLTGHDREEIGLLAFANPAACKSLCPDAPDDASLVDLIGRPQVRDAVAAGLRAHNRDNSANSRRIARVLLLAEPPDIDANEITDKGYINQRAVLENRAVLVERLYAGDADVIVID